MTPADLYRQERAKRGRMAPGEPVRRQCTPSKRYTTTAYRCGHLRTPENTYTNQRTQVTACLQCRRARSSRKAPAFRSFSGAIKVQG